MLRKIYEVKDDTKCRVWHRYLTNSYELLSDPSQTLQDAGLYSGQVIYIDVALPAWVWSWEWSSGPGAHGESQWTRGSW